MCSTREWILQTKSNRRESTHSRRGARSPLSAIKNPYDRPNKSLESIHGRELKRDCSHFRVGASLAGVLVVVQDIDFPTRSLLLPYSRTPD